MVRRCVAHGDGQRGRRRGESSADTGVHSAGQYQALWQVSEWCGLFTDCPEAV